jgi:hypothetical protein
MHRGPWGIIAGQLGACAGGLGREAVAFSGAPSPTSPMEAKATKRERG